MLNLKQLVCFFLLFVSLQSINAQLGFSHEIGAIAGPVQFRSDYGLREEGETNFGNSGFGVGIVHYINFSYRSDCNCYSTDTFFNDHFKLRNEISYNRTKLEHFGEWVADSKTSDNSERLRSQSGYAKNLDVGTQLEFFPLSIRDFQGFAYRFSPYVSLGIHYTYSSPEATTTYGDGNVFDEENIYSFWYADPTFLPALAAGEEREYPIDTASFSTLSVVSSVGVRYKLTRVSDLVLDLRWQYYFSDWVDGLNHQLNSNQNNDWLVWLNFGYIYYLN
ncbi:THC0290_0291 family protein [Neotamlana laminarinivorans]|uniref:Glutamate dehydrogenase n=1 Tax=Neotamlana laminarinivorans TaxID=2883124 RepID=A0A9X1L2W3_9FLAO|nr:glutamate dehydrogenase [Tamlana laminarinivorans]MCB4798029.1 glutamate dehydrogenase [Tamlana laminarinivorans]